MHASLLTRRLKACACCLHKRCRARPQSRFGHAWPTFHKVGTHALQPQEHAPPSAAAGMALQCCALAICVLHHFELCAAMAEAHSEPLSSPTTITVCHGNPVRQLRTQPSYKASAPFSSSNTTLWCRCFVCLFRLLRQHVCTACMLSGVGCLAKSCAALLWPLSAATCTLLWHVRGAVVSHR